MANRIDFNVLHTRVMKYQNELQLQTPSEAFPYVVMDSVLGLSDNETENCITDGPQDRGIDAIYIEEDSESDNAVIHIFQFKYTTDPRKIDNNFPGGEVDKILTIIEDIMSPSGELQSGVNPVLWEKIKDIQEVLDRNIVPSIILYFCGNMQELTPSEKKRVERGLRVYHKLAIEHYTIEKLVKILRRESRKIINGQIRFYGKEYFERSSANVRAIIGVISALDLIEMLLLDEAGDIQEAIFEDNIRIYQGTKKNPINQSILETALDQEKNHEFVYLNNGITMTCDKFEYIPRHSPVVDLKNVQIVNGSQTSHALFEAYNSLQADGKNLLDSVLVLVRVYETDKDIVQRIVQTTNSQTVISSRDLRANDPIQLSLHTEMLDKGFYYETKRNLYQDKPKEKRLDAEVVGQILMSYYQAKPDEVKYKKREIFGKNYPEVFDVNFINADRVLAPLVMFRFIEAQKRSFQAEIRNTEDYDPRFLFLTHASFFILYGMKLMIDKTNTTYSYENIDKVKQFYSPIINILADLVEEAEEVRDKKYSHNSFFRQKGTVRKLEHIILEGE